ncbi:MAG TPA: porin [Ramlibacter sp.]|nr:porin [Ramlibacter sp.]
MRKTQCVALIGLACAGGGFAQVAGVGAAPVTGSSLTMFGVVDTAVAWGHGSLTHLTRVVSGGLNSSRLGFRSVENLGGGLGAGFWLESGVNSDDGSGGASNTNNLASGATVAGGLTFGRRSTVSLISEWGELRLGRDQTSIFRNRDQTDPFGTNGVGTMQPQVGTIAGVTATRASNMVIYLLPAQRLGGFFGEAEYYLGEQPSGSAGDGWQARLGYATKVWGLAGAYGRTNGEQTATTGNVKSWNVGAHWDFGVARLTGGYFEDKVERTAPLKGTGWLVGAVIPIGTNLFRLAYSTYGTDAAGDPKTKKVALGYVHNLSKRTALYASYAHVNNSGPATTSLNGSTTDPGRNSDGVDLGLRHSF